ncbi:MAG: S8 family serine peptidase, partial [Ilumatobacteraceae bacterium]
MSERPHARSPHLRYRCHIPNRYIDNPDVPVTIPLIAITTLLPTSTWGLDRIDITDASPVSSGAVDVYVIDSGVAPHPDLAGRLEPGIDFVDGASSATADGTNDCNGHGTHVAGIVAGSQTGVAPN